MKQIKKANNMALALITIFLLISVLAACPEIPGRNDKPVVPDPDVSPVLYTVSFDTAGGVPAEIESVEVSEGCCLADFEAYPADPQKAHSVFLGWYYDNARYDADTPIYDDIILVAAWTNAEYTITFNTAGGSPSTIAPVKVIAGASMASKYPANPSKANYDFDGWYSGETKYESSTLIYGNTALTAVWNIRVYTVSFDTAGGTPATIAAVTVNAGASMASNYPANPSKTNYNFDGWYSGETKYESSTLIYGNITLTAAWKMKEYTVTFDTSGGTPATIPSITVTHGTSMGSKYPANPGKTGYVFDGWYSGETKYESGTPIYANVALVARWELTGTLPPTLVMGTATNPLIKGDVPDISVIRVGNAYYMISTTMYFCPVAPIMKSYDLVNWRIVSYCGDILEDLPNFRLETNTTSNIGDYGRGQWAASLNYFKDRFWVIFKNNTTNKSYRYSTTDPDNGPWEKVIINRGFHDPSIFYDSDTDRTFIFHGADNITLTEMNSDLTAVKSGGIDKNIITDKEGFVGVGEGSQVYKLNGYYYVFTISWNPNRRCVHCFRSTKIDGPYTEKVVLNNAPSGGGGVAQGSIVNTPDGDWYGVFFQDRGAVGRIPYLIPMTWSSDNWPVFGTANTGNNNSVGTIPTSFQKMLAQGYETNLYYSDEFDYDSNKLHLAWQWNHNPDNTKWSLTERPGYLRLTTGRTSKNIYFARNTLTQRTREPSSTAEIALETTNMKDGDIAGLVALQAICGFVGIEQDGNQKYIVMYTGDNDSTNYRGNRAIVDRKANVSFSGNKIYLRAVGTFGQNSSSVVFSYRTNESQSWTNIGTTVNPTFSLQHFTGVRFGLFNYATKTAGGYVDFDYYRVN